MAKKAEGRGTRKPGDAERLAALHAVGLFTELSTESLPAKRSKEVDALADAIDARADEIRSATLYRAIQDIPPGLGVERVLVPAGRSHVRITSGEHEGIYCPRTHHEHAELVNVALSTIGDERRLVALKVRDWEEPLFLLASAEQRRVAREAGIEDPWADKTLPAPIPMRQHLAQLAQQLASKLPKGCPSPRVDESAIAVELTKRHATELVELLYVERYRTASREARFARELP